MRLEAAKRRGWRSDNLATDFFRRMEVFLFLDSDELERLTAVAEWQDYAPRQEVVGLEALGFSYFVAKGNLRVFRLSVEGQELTVGELSPGAIVGPLLAAPGQLPKTLLEGGAGGATLCRIPHAFLRGLEATNPCVAECMARLLWGRIEQAYEQMESLAYEPVPKRVRRVLAQQALSSARQEIEMTREELATMVGSRREQVSRAMSELRREGVVECPSRGQIVVVDPSRLVREEAFSC